MRSIIVGIPLLLGVLAQAQTSPRSQASSERGLTEGVLVREVLEVKRQYDVAQLANDGTWFERMLAEDYVFIAEDGVVSSKAQIIDDMQSHNLIWDSVAAKDMKVRVYENTAVVTGRFFGKGRYKGNALNVRQRFTSVWIKRSGRWQGISEHGSTLNPSDQ